MMLDPASCAQVLPLPLTHRPLRAMPAMMLSEPGTAETIVRLPHSDAMFARLPVTFTHALAAAAAGCAASVRKSPAPKARTRISTHRGSALLISVQIIAGSNSVRTGDFTRHCPDLHRYARTAARARVSTLAPAPAGLIFGR